MAKLAFLFTVIFVLFAFTNARVPLVWPESDVIDVKSEPKTAFNEIFLPSHRQEVEDESIPPEEWQLKRSESEGSESETRTVDSSEIKKDVKVDSVPLTVVTFRPFNHRFPNRPFSLPFRHGRPCRHHHRFQQFRSQGQIAMSNDMIDSNSDRHAGKFKRDVSNDMILSGDNTRFEREFGADTHQIPARWMSFRHGEYQLPHNKLEVLEFEEEEKPHHHHHHQHRHDSNEEKKDEEEEHHHHRHHHDSKEDETERKERKGGIMRKIRKFLNHF